MDSIAFVSMLLVLVQWQFCDANLNCENYKASAKVPNQKNHIKYCIAQCLDLVNAESKNVSKKCEFNPKSGGAIGGKCKESLSYDSAPEKKIICSFDVGTDFPVAYHKMKNSRACTHWEYYGFVKFNTTTNDLKVRTEKASVYQELAIEARKYNIKNVIRIGSWDDYIIKARTFSKIASDPELRMKYARQVRDILVENNLDGAMLSWYSPVCPLMELACPLEQDKKGVINLVKDLSSFLQPAGKSLAYMVLASFTDTPFTAGIIYNTLVPYVDYFILEVSVQTGDYNAVAEFTFNLQKTIDILNSFKKKIGYDQAVLKKIMFGIRSEFMQVELKNISKNMYGSQVKNSRAIQIPKSVTIAEACQKLRSKNYTIVKNSTTQNYAYFDKFWFSYDDYDSLKAKIDYLKNDIGGAGVWLDLTVSDDRENKCGCGKLIYLRMVAELLNGGDCTFEPCF